MTTAKVAPGPLDRRLAVAALDLLSHWWSRPSVSELATWEASSALAKETVSELGGPDALAEAASWVPHTVDEMLELVDEHERLFAGAGAAPCPPYESYWTEAQPVASDRRGTSDSVTELGQIYRELDLDVTPGGEPPDHIAVELEATAYALSLGDSDEVAERLLSEHVLKWLAGFCDAVARAARHEFYPRLAAITVDWLEKLTRRPVSPGQPHDPPA
jgi:TorA maturation chaperone TorD